MRTRLKSLFLFAAFVCVVCATLVYPLHEPNRQASERKRLASLVAEKGGYVRVVDGIVTGVTFRRSSVTDDDVASIEWNRMPMLYWLDLGAPQLSNETIDYLDRQGVSGLKYLSFHGSAISSEHAIDFCEKHGCMLVSDLSR